jgi:hypothetical protein
MSSTAAPVYCVRCGADCYGSLSYVNSYGPLCPLCSSRVTPSPVEPYYRFLDGPNTPVIPCKRCNGTGAEPAE